MRRLARWRPRPAAPSAATLRAAARAEATALLERDGRSGPDLPMPPSVPAGAPQTGATAGAAWVLLLPRLELGTVLCVGLPSAAALATLTRCAETVAVACAGPEERDRATRRAAAAGADNVVAFVPADGLRPIGAVDLAVICGGRATARLAGGGWVADAVAAAPTAFVDLGAGMRGAGTAAHVRRLTAHPGRSLALQMAPGVGDARSIAAAGDATMLARLEEIAAADAPLRGGDVRAFARRAGPRHGGNRRAALVAGAGDDDDDRRVAVPAYVREIAAAAGVDVASHRVGLSAPTEDRARPALMLLAAVGETRPQYVVKIARASATNARLIAEHAALELVEQAGVGADGSVPRSAFLGEHAGRAVHGLTAVEGVSLRRATSGRADCPHVRSALAWLHDLAAATARPAPDPAAVVARLGSSLARFADLHELGEHQRAHLDDCLATVERHAHAVPLVLAHGDASVANVLVGADSRVAWVGWQHGRADGLPLWDLCSLAHSLSASIARTAGVGGGINGFGRQLLREQALTRLLADAIERQRRAIELPPALVEPLVLGCWIDRALDEARRLPPRRLDGGHYVNLVRLSIDRRDAPGLRRLYGATDAAAPRGA